MNTGLPKQIIGSFEDIGKDVLSQTANVPKDVVGKALESLTGQGGKKQGQGKQVGQPKRDEQGPLQEFDKAPDMGMKKVIARAALEWLSGKRPPKKEESIWEKQQKEKQEKEQMAKAQAEIQRKQELPKMSQKRKSGDLYGLKAKTSSTEVGRNVRQD